MYRCSQTSESDTSLTGKWYFQQAEDKHNPILCYKESSIPSVLLKKYPYNIELFSNGEGIFRNANDTSNQYITVFWTYEDRVLTLNFGTWGKSEPVHFKIINLTSESCKVEIITKGDSKPEVLQP